MSGPGRRAAVVAATVAGLLVGAITTLALTEPPVPGGAAGVDDAAGLDVGSTGTVGTVDPLDQADPGTTTTSVASRPPTARPESGFPADTLLVWTTGGLPPGLESPMAGLQGVEAVTLVRGDEAALVSTALPDGTPVDQMFDGWTIPLDVIAVDPTTYSHFVGGPAATAVLALQPGQALLTETSASLRRLVPGSTVHLETGAVTVAGVIDDLSGAGAELIAHIADAPALDVGTERYLLVDHDGDRAELQQLIAEQLLSGHTIRFRSPAETTWLRHGDGVDPQAWVKSAFGEFATRDGSGRSVEVDPAWLARSIVTEEVPILGTVTCHREVVGRLRAALTELSDANLDHLVDPASYAGCFSARRIAAGQPMSRHAWGAAVDLNVGDNPRGSFSTQDPRLIEAMRANGFTWGGTWLVPDPAHYEATSTGG